MMKELEYLDQIVDPFHGFEELHSNGVTIYHLHRPGVLYHKIAWVFFCGSSNEKVPGSGVAHFLEHVIMRNAHSRMKERNLELFFENNATTGYGYTFYTLCCNKDILEEIYGDMVNTISNPDYSWMEKERGAILSETWRSMSYEELKTKRCHEIAFGRPHHLIIGDYERIVSADAHALEEYYSENYTLGNVRILSVGGLDKENILDMCSRNPLRLPKGKDNNPKLRKLESVPGPGSFIANHNPSCKLAGLSMVFMVNSRDDCLVIVSSKMIEIALERRLRTVENIVYAVNRSWTFHPGHYEVEFSINGVHHENLNKVFLVIKECLETAKTDKELLDEVKALHLRLYLYDISNSDRFNSAIYKIAREGCVFEDKRDIRREMDMSIDDIKGFMDIYSLEKAIVIVSTDREEIDIDCL